MVVRPSLPESEYKLNAPVSKKANSRFSIMNKNVRTRRVRKRILSNLGFSSLEAMLV